MNINRKQWVNLATIVLLAILVYLLTVWVRETIKRIKHSRAINRIVDTQNACFISKIGSNRCKQWLRTLEPTYIIAWGEAIKKGENSFNHNNQTFVTKGGTKRK